MNDQRDFFCESFRVTGFNHKTANPILNHVGAVGGADDRDASGHGFQNDHAKGVRERREHQNISLGV